MFKARYLGLTVTCGLLCASCKETEEVAPAVAGSAAPTSAAASSAPARRRRAPGDNPFGFASLPLQARAGDYALVPSKTAIDGAFEQGASEQTFVYLGAHLEEISDRESRVRWLTQQQAFVANALIVPIRGQERAKPGDVVLTSWASGSGLQRAIVVSGGSSESPQVRYLDFVIEDTPARADEVDTLPPNTFHVLRKPGEPGTTLACVRDNRAEHLVLIKRASPRILGLGFAGRLHVLEERQCVPAPIAPAVALGDAVFVPHVGRFWPAQVEKIDRPSGRVHVRHHFAGEERRAAVGFTNVAIELPTAR